MVECFVFPKTRLASDFRDYLKQQAVQKDLGDYTDKLKKDAGVEILDPKLVPPEKPAAATLPAGHPAVTPEKKK